jgi:hypothetical protein
LLRIALWLGGLLAILIVLELIGISPLNWLRAVFRAMGEVPPQYIAAGIFTQTCNLLLVGLAYVAIWRAAFPRSVSIPVMQIATCYIVSIALNGVLPMSLGTITMIFMFIAILPGATAAGVAAGYGVGQIFWASASAFTCSGCSPRPPFRSSKMTKELPAPFIFQNFMAGDVMARRGGG